MQVSELDSRRGVTGTPAAASAAAAATKACQLLGDGSMSITDDFRSKDWVEGTRFRRCCCCSSADGVRSRGAASGSQIGIDVDLVSSMLAFSLLLRDIMMIVKQSCRDRGLWETERDHRHRCRYG